MKIPSLVQGVVETEDGKVFELDSSKGFAWLESIGSFRFEPNGSSKPYTVRKESGVYWYGCRKVAGKVRKKYIGKSSEVTLARLEEVANALEVASAQSVNAATGAVAEVAQKVAEVAEVTEVVTQVAEVAEDRLAALELQVANLQRAVEALQDALSGKLEPSDSLELPKVDNEVAEQLQNDLSNPNPTELALRLEIDRLQAELETCRQQPFATSKLPEAANLLNQMKAKRKKSTTSLADVELILEIIEKS
jgi:hypothetical protein